MNADLCAILLAAGSGRRFGGGKLLAPLAGKPLYRHIFDVAGGCGFGQVIAVTNEESIARYARELGFLPVDNPNAEEGVASSIRRGLASSETAGAWMFFVCDQPYLTLESVRGIVERFRATGRAVIPRFGGVPGNPCLFPAFCREGLLALSGDAGGKQVLCSLPQSQIAYADFPHAREGRDIDTRQDYEEAASR